jgi:hypothetical protein
MAQVDNFSVTGELKFMQSGLDPHVIACNQLQSSMCYWCKAVGCRWESQWTTRWKIGDGEYIVCQMAPEICSLEGKMEEVLGQWCLNISEPALLVYQKLYGLLPLPGILFSHMAHGTLVVRCFQPYNATSDLQGSKLFSDFIVFPLQHFDAISEYNWWEWSSIVPIHWNVNWLVTLREGNTVGNEFASQNDWWHCQSEIWDVTMSLVAGLLQSDGASQIGNWVSLDMMLEKEDKLTIVGYVLLLKWDAGVGFGDEFVSKEQTLNQTV